MEPAQLIALGYFSAIAVAALAEIALPVRRPPPGSLRGRWTANIGLALIDTVIIRLIVPLGMVEAARLSAANQFGLLAKVNVGDGGAAWWAAALVTFLILDLGKYAQHLALHRLPWLWRFHAAHHTDRDYDFTTGLRFHPVEAVLTVSFDLALVLLLGGPVEAVLAYEMTRITLSLLAHTNVKLPDGLDRVLRLVLVTPNAHRLHHAVAYQQRDCNLGTVFTWWDRLAGSWRSVPADILPSLAIGSDDRAVPTPGLAAVLLAPFRRAAPAG